MSTHKNIATDLCSATTAAKSDGTAGALSDTLDLRRVAQGIIIHAAGTVRVTPEDAEDGTYQPLPALAVGVAHPIGFKRLWSTGTTVVAANITLLYGKF